MKLTFCSYIAIMWSMEVRFVDGRLDQLEIDPKFNAGFAQNIVSAFRRRMQQIRSAPDERVFYQLKSLQFEKLKGKRSHQHSMRLNKQWRLIMKFEGRGASKRAVIISIEDYH